ncbi:MAG: NAD-dependent epimerase/dehydratase family protein [Candidatus Thorarchaeota archaeon]|nr:MAG: NAD-dependent epimerase/dehydratase family protein [Candidatus Thorarchaeota archaeon]
MSSVKVLVTGATGFLGGKTIELILKEGHEAVALVRSTSNREGLPKNIEVREADLFDEASLEKALQDIDAVIHFAAYFDFYPRDEELMFKVNIEGTKNLMNACVGTKVQRFIYCSSTETMGPIRFPPGTEDTELRPDYSYGESKVLAERAIREISKDTDLGHIILRPTGVMGEGDLYVMYEVAQQLYEGKVFALPSDLSAEFMYTHADDVVAGFVAALTPMSALNNTFILCPDEPMSWEEFVDVMTTRLGVKPPRLRVPRIFAKFGMMLLSPFKNRKKNSFFWHGKSVDMMFATRVYSNEKAKRLLGWTPKVTMVEGFQRAIDWYFENGFLKKRE